MSNFLTPTNSCASPKPFSPRRSEEISANSLIIATSFTKLEHNKYECVTCGISFIYSKRSGRSSLLRHFKKHENASITYDVYEKIGKIVQTNMCVMLEDKALIRNAINLMYLKERATVREKVTNSDSTVGLMFANGYGFLASGLNVSFGAAYLVLSPSAVTSVQASPSYYFLCHIIINQEKFRDLKLNEVKNYNRILVALRELNVPLARLAFVYVPDESHSQVVKFLRNARDASCPPMAVIRCLAFDTSCLICDRDDNEHITKRAKRVRQCMLTNPSMTLDKAKALITKLDSYGYYSIYEAGGVGVQFFVEAAVKVLTGEEVQLNDMEKVTLEPFESPDHKKTKGTGKQQQKVSNYQSLNWIPATSVAATGRFQLCLPLLLTNGLSNLDSILDTEASEGLESSMIFFDL